MRKYLKLSSAAHVIGALRDQVIRRNIMLNEVNGQQFSVISGQWEGDYKGKYAMTAI